MKLLVLWNVNLFQTLTRSQRFLKINLRPALLIFHSKYKMHILRIKKYKIWAFKLTRKFCSRSKEKRKLYLEVERLSVQE